jgi:hypothetical protein
MSVLMPAAVLSAIVLAVLLYRRRQTRASIFTMSAFALLLVALIITLGVNVPIDRQIQSWTTATLPPDWSAIRDRWEFYHGLRTLVSLFALACLFAGTLSTANIVRITSDQRGERYKRRTTPRPICCIEGGGVSKSIRSRKLDRLKSSERVRLSRPPGGRAKDTATSEDGGRTGSCQPRPCSGGWSARALRPARPSRAFRLRWRR